MVESEINKEYEKPRVMGWAIRLVNEITVGEVGQTKCMAISHLLRYMCLHVYAPIN